MLRKLWWRRLLRELKELGGLRCNYSSVSSPNWIAFTGGAGWAPSVEAGASLRTDCHLPTVRQLQWFLKKGRKMVFWSEALSLAVLCLMEPFALSILHAQLHPAYSLCQIGTLEIPAGGGKVRSLEHCTWHSEWKSLDLIVRGKRKGGSLCKSERRWFTLGYLREQQPVYW